MSTIYDPEVVALLRGHGVRGDITYAARTDYGLSYVVADKAGDVYVMLTAPMRHVRAYARGWHLTMDGDLAAHPRLISYARWRSLGTAVRAAERARAGRWVRLPTGLQSGLCPL